MFTVRRFKALGPKCGCLQMIAASTQSKVKLSGQQKGRILHRTSTNFTAGLHCGLDNYKQSLFSNTWSVLKHTIMTDTPKIELSVSPKRHLLVDDELQIVLRGLSRGEIVTIHAVLREEGKVYESCSSFQADNDGVVNVAKQPSRSGTYTGVSPMGLFWSMVPAPGQQEGIRLMKKDMDTPFKTVLYTYSGEMSLEELHNSKLTPINVSEINRYYKGQGVTIEAVRDGKVRGKLYLPKGPGPFPGIIDLFGTVGGITEYRAALLASKGFATLALPYFAYEDLPQSFMDLDLEYFLEAIDWLLDHKKVQSEGIGVIGTSKGGDLALLMGAHSTKVSAIVNVNGCTFNASVPIQYRGETIPCVEVQLDKFKSENGYYIMKDSLDYEEKDLIPVWNNNPKVLHILSEDDLCSPKECIRLMKRCYPADKTDNCTVLAYDKAGHLLEPPYGPLCRFSYHKSFGMFFLWGGYPEEHAVAQEDAWRNILKFFHEHIPKGKHHVQSNL